MKKLGLFLIFALTLSAPVQSVEREALTPSRRGVTFEPCMNWWYDFDLGSYACRWRGANSNFYRSEEVDSIIAKLRARTDELEARIKALESKP